MKQTLIALLVAALLLSLTGCMRGGNADTGHDGYLGDDEAEDRSVADDVRDGLDDVRDDVKDGIDDVRDGIDDILPDVEDMPEVDNGRDGRIGGRIGHIPDESGRVYPGGRGQNDSGNSSNFGGGLNGSGVTGNEGAVNNGSTLPGTVPYGVIR